MEYIISASTDVGIRRETNQDSMIVTKAKTPIGNVAFAVMCDGMGGLSRGEVASASMIQAFSEWFHMEFPKLAHKPLEDFEIRRQWNEIVNQKNEELLEYGRQNNIKLGTTAVALLLTSERYYIMNVGDSRAYEICGMVQQLTEDQTLVEREVREGILTLEEARYDSRRNVLLQCVGGSSQAVYPEMYFGETKQNAVYLLCSDGFVHEIDSVEMFSYLNPDVLMDKKTMQENAHYLIELLKQRKETDNISVVLIRTFEEETIPEGGTEDGWGIE